MLTTKQQEQVANNQGLVFDIVNKLSRRSNLVRRLGFDDAVQAGNIGLINAVLKFSTDFGQLSTYAYKAIQRCIMNAAKQQYIIHIPRHVIDAMFGAPQQLTVKDKFIAFAKKCGKYRTAH